MKSGYACTRSRLSQLAALTAIRYNKGNIISLVPVIQQSNLTETQLYNAIGDLLYGGVNSANFQQYISRTQKECALYFHGTYGDMPIDAINYKVIS